MLRYTFGLSAEADAVEAAVAAVLKGPSRTGDIIREGKGEKLTGTREMGKLIRDALVSA
jgi:3-isopropylmalate dehydrogenase